MVTPDIYPEGKPWSNITDPRTATRTRRGRHAVATAIVPRVPAARRRPPCAGRWPPAHAAPPLPQVSAPAPAPPACPEPAELFPDSAGRKLFARPPPHGNPRAVAALLVGIARSELIWDHFCSRLLPSALRGGADGAPRSLQRPHQHRTPCKADRRWQRCVPAVAW